jgi:type I restriction enzyme S subunit
MTSKNYKTFKLNDLCQIKYGKDHKKLSEGEIPVYGTGGLMRYVNSFIYDKPSVLIPRKGTLSNIFFVEKKFWTVDTLFWTLIDETKVSPKYLYYVLKTFNLEEMNVGSAVPSLTTTLLNNLEIKLPPLKKQFQIERILTNIDSKIEINNKINTNLEELAQSIYKRWFVDFEFPNEEGKPYKSSGGQMVDSELGLIPKNWEIKKYSEFFDIKYGKSIYSSKDKTEIGEYKVYGAGGVISKTDHFDYEESEIIVGCRGTCGNVNLTEPKSKITHNSLIIRTNKRYKFFSYLSIKILDLSPFITGSTQPQITIKDLSKNKIIIPNEKNVLMFEMLTVNFFDKIFNLEKQNDKLSNLRDLLLPKLMSGEIEVPDME